MTDEQQTQVIYEEDPTCKAFEEWVMRNKTIISIATFGILVFISKYMGWLHH